MRTPRKKTSGKSKPEVMVLDMADLDELLARIRAAGVSQEDCAKIEALGGTVAWLHEELDNKRLTVARLRSLFGLNTSEKSKDLLKPQDDGKSEQPSEDSGEDESEDSSDDPKPDPNSDEKRKGHGRNGASAYEGADQVKVPHGSLEPGAPCPICEQGKVYMQRKPRTLVRIVGQAPLQATVYELERLRCNLCGEIFTAEPPQGIGKEKYDATAASMIALLKYGSGLPFNRLERLERDLGIPLPAATQWDVVQAAANELAGLHDELIRQAAQGRVIHNDDTSMRVLTLRRQIEIEQRSGKSKSGRTGIFLTNIVSELEGNHRIALYFTGRNHAGENLADLLAHRAAALGPPIQMCDGLDRNLPKGHEIDLANCLVHGRRKFVELLESFPDECRHVIEILREVYKHEATTRERGLSDEARLLFHQEHSRPLMDDLKSWMREQIDEKRVEPNSSLGGAIEYMTKRWGRLTLFLRKSGAPLDNNISERAIKKAILHRRNSLFYKTENGAWVGDVFMSLIHTAELAHANSLEYLTVLIKHGKRVCREPARWMPWNYASALAECADQAATAT